MTDFVKAGSALSDLREKLEAKREELRAAGVLLTEEESEPCPHCGGAGYLWKRAEVALDSKPEFVVCECFRDEYERRRLKRLLGTSGLEGLEDWTFPNSAPKPGQNDWWREGKRYAAEPTGWLWLTGSYGSGKTRLAVCIANEQIATGRGVVFRVVPKLLDDLRATFDKDATVSFEDRFGAVLEAPLLVLDDLGTEARSNRSGDRSWGAEKLFQILNERWLYRRPTVVTTNLATRDLEPRLQSRVTDGSLCTILTMVGKDARR